MQAKGIEVALAQGDVSSADDAEAMVRDVEAPARPGRHPGQQRRHHPRHHLPQDDARSSGREVIGTNLNSCFNVTRPVIEGMRARKWGRIIQIASINGQKGQYGQANYAAAKAGMHGFTISLAQENAKFGITVNTVSPGYIGTDMVMAVPEEVRNKIVAQIPTGRLGEPGRDRLRRGVLPARRGRLDHRRQPVRQRRPVHGLVTRAPRLRRRAGEVGGDATPRRLDPAQPPVHHDDLRLLTGACCNSAAALRHARAPRSSGVDRTCQSASSRNIRTVVSTTPRSPATSPSRTCASSSSTARSSRCATPRPATTSPAACCCRSSPSTSRRANRCSPPSCSARSSGSTGIRCRASWAATSNARCRCSWNSSSSSASR